MSYDPEHDPLTLAVNRAFNTGETVMWKEGDPLPDPGGEVMPLSEEAVNFHRSRRRERIDARPILVRFAVRLAIASAFVGGLYALAVFTR